jgi:hypothetical protein
MYVSCVAALRSPKHFDVTVRCLCQRYGSEGVIVNDGLIGYYIDNAVLGRCFLQQRIASAIVLMNDNSLNKSCI